MSETQVTIPEGKTVVLTSENSAAFYERKLTADGLMGQPPVVKEEVKTEVVPEAKTEEIKTEEVKAEPKAGEPEQGTEQTADGKKPPPIAKRFSDMTRKIEAAEERARAAEAKTRELEAKLAPPKVETVVVEDGKPDPEKYTDAFKYAEDLTKWTVKQENAARDKAAQESKANESRELTVKVWRERQDAFTQEAPDYADTIAASPVVVSNEIRDAILESEVGPRILYHFAQHPEDAERIGKLTVGGALRELGKLEARLEKPKAEAKAEVKVAEVSKAPAPITPIKGGGSGVENLINSKGEFTGTPKQYRDLRRAGKIH